MSAHDGEETQFSCHKRPVSVGCTKMSPKYYSDNAYSTIFGELKYFPPSYEHWRHNVVVHEFPSLWGRCGIIWPPLCYWKIILVLSHFLTANVRYLQLENIMKSSTAILSQHRLVTFNSQESQIFSCTFTKRCLIKILETENIWNFLSRYNIYELHWKSIVKRHKNVGKICQESCQC